MHWKAPLGFISRLRAHPAGESPHLHCGAGQRGDRCRPGRGSISSSFSTPFGEGALTPQTESAIRQAAMSGAENSKKEVIKFSCKNTLQNLSNLTHNKDIQSRIVKDFIENNLALYK